MSAQDYQEIERPDERGTHTEQADLGRGLHDSNSSRMIDEMKSASSQTAELPDLNIDQTRGKGTVAGNVAEALNDGLRKLSELLTGEKPSKIGGGGKSPGIGAGERPPVIRGHEMPSGVGAGETPPVIRVPEKPPAIGTETPPVIRGREKLPAIGTQTPPVIRVPEKPPAIGTETPPVIRGREKLPAIGTETPPVIRVPEKPRAIGSETPPVIRVPEKPPAIGTETPPVIGGREKTPSMGAGDTPTVIGGKRKLPPEIQAVVRKTIGLYDTIAVDLEKKSSAIERKLEELGALISNPKIPGVGSFGPHDPLRPVQRNEGAVIILKSGDSVLADTKEKPLNRTKPEEIDEKPAEDSPHKEKFKEEKEAASDQILTRLKRSGLSDGQLDVIKDSINTLEKRKTDFDDRISDRELAKVYQAINRLLEANDGAKLSQQQRITLAQQILFQAAHPDEISQGYHNTCNVTTLETIMYSRQPSLVSKVVVDAALTGQFKTADDTVVKLSAQNLRPDAEASNNPPFDGERSFASQLFQETAVNVYWQRQSVAPDGSIGRKGDVHYEVGIRDAAIENDTGERLVGSDGKSLKDNNGKIVNHPKFDLPEMQDVYQQIAGKTPFVLMVDHLDYYNDKKGVITPKSVDELKDLLKELKEGSKYGKLPIVLGLPSHVMVITDYDPKTGEVAVDNSWSRKDDYLSKPGTGAKKTVEQVFQDIRTWKPPREGVR